MASNPPTKKKSFWFKRCKWCEKLMIIAEYRIEGSQWFYHKKCYLFIYNSKYDR